MIPLGSNYNMREGILPPGNNKLIHEQKTPFQLIRLFQNGTDYWMSLNGVIQFHTKECYLSHKYMCVRPLQLLGRRPKKVLLIGGGDGLPTRELLRHIPNLTQVELDRELIEFTQKHPVMRKISNNSFNTPRVELIAGDGLRYLTNSKEKYDIIIDDCDYEISNQPGTKLPGTAEADRGEATTKAEILYQNYKSCMISKLTPGGIAVMMEPIGWPWADEKSNQGVKGSIIDQWHLSKSRQWESGPLSHRKQIVKKATNGHIEDWEEYTPYVHGELIELPFIGPEYYIYLSNRPIFK